MGDVIAASQCALATVRGETPAVSLNTRFLLEHMQAHTIKLYRDLNPA